MFHLFVASNTRIYMHSVGRIVDHFEVEVPHERALQQKWFIEEDLIVDP